MPTIGLATEQAQIVTLAQSVYTRALWSDEWELNEDLHCEESTWCLFPVLPTASFLWRYGAIQNVEDSEFFHYSRMDRTYRVYVKVVWQWYDFQNTLKSRTWYGIIQVDEDEILGQHVIDRLNTGEPIPAGHQRLHAYGMEKLLADGPIRRAFWWDAAGAKDWFTEILPDFNRRGKPNRTADEVSESAHSFEPETDPAKEVAQFWSTRDVVNYLIRACRPEDENGDVQVDFGFGGINGLSALTWDRPVVRQKDRTVFECLQQDLVHHGKLLCAWFDVRDVFEVETVCLNTNTLTDVAVTIPQPGSPTIPANNRQSVVVFKDDNYTRVVIKRSEVAIFDQIVCRGAPLIAVGSFSVQDATLQKGWNTSLEVEYAEGANITAGWNLTKKREADREFRSQQKFRDVYGKLVIPTDWDRKVRDYSIADDAEADEDNPKMKPMFPVESLGETMSDSSVPQPYFGDTFLEHELPLLLGVDYSDDKISAGSYDETLCVDRKHAPPVLVWVVPNTDPKRYVEANHLGTTQDLLQTDRDNNNRWSGHVAVDGESHAIRVEISGHEQHSGAEELFRGYAKETDIPYGKYQINTAIVTLALKSGRHCEGVWPPDADFQPTVDDHGDPVDPVATIAGDVLLRKVFNLGDDYTTTYVVPGTVLGIDRDGDLVVTGGGYIPKPGTDDNEHRLQAQAKMLHAYYSRQRKVVDVTTVWFADEAVLQLGDLITTVGQSGDPTCIEVNSFVSSITFRHAQGTGDRRPAPQMHFATWAGELDPISPQPWKAGKPARPYSQGEAEAAAMRQRELARLK